MPPNMYEPELYKDPLLFFKVGVLGSSALDMAQALANELTASLISSDQIRADIIAATNSIFVNSNLIKGVFRRDAAAHLQELDSVVGDIYFNTAKSRMTPVEIARDTGAKTIALSMHVSYRQAIERVEQWAESGQFLIPLSQWEIHPVAVAKTMMQHIDRPDKEDIDHVINVDGRGEASGQVDQIIDYLDQKHLIH